jgi:hypothetical protein
MIQFNFHPGSKNYINIVYQFTKHELVSQTTISYELDFVIVTIVSPKKGSKRKFVLD